MGEIDDAHHAENDGKTERHQAVDETGQYALDEDFEVKGEGHKQLKLLVAPLSRTRTQPSVRRLRKLACVAWSGTQSKCICPWTPDRIPLRFMRPGKWERSNARFCCRGTTTAHW